MFGLSNNICSFCVVANDNQTFKLTIRNAKEINEDDGLLNN